MSEQEVNLFQLTSGRMAQFRRMAKNIGTGFVPSDCECGVSLGDDAEADVTRRYVAVNNWLRVKRVGLTDSFRQVREDLMPPDRARANLARRRVSHASPA
jgi:hypothetical protein